MNERSLPLVLKTILTGFQNDPDRFSKGLGVFFQTAVTPKNHDLLLRVAVLRWCRKFGGGNGRLFCSGRDPDQPSQIFRNHHCSR